MKKLLTVITLIAALLVGGCTVDAKTTKKKTKARTSYAAKKSASKPAGALAMWKPNDRSCSVYLMKDNTVKACGDADGRYFVDNGAYIAVYGSGVYGDNVVDVIYGDTCYKLIISFYDNSDFWSYLNDVNWDYSKAISFDTNSQTITLKTTSGNQTVKLSDIPTDRRFKVTWY